MAVQDNRPHWDNYFNVFTFWRPRVFLQMSFHIFANVLPSSFAYTHTLYVCENWTVIIFKGFTTLTSQVQQHEKQDISYLNARGSPIYRGSKQEAGLCARCVSTLWPAVLQPRLCGLWSKTHIYLRLRVQDRHEGNYSDTAKCCHMTRVIE